MAFDPQHPDIDESKFGKYDWHDFYRVAKEPIPGDMPEAHGNVVSTHCFVDADHAGNCITRRSQTGILLFVMRAPVVWYSKRQNTVKTSILGIEVVAMRISLELVEALHYKLRMFRIPIEGVRISGFSGFSVLKFEVIRCLRDQIGSWCFSVALVEIKLSNEFLSALVFRIG